MEEKKEDNFYDKITASTRPKISIVVPLLNEARNIPVLYERLKDVLSEITTAFEILFVDDGSTDDSVVTIKKLSANDKRVMGVSLSRNFGHQAALTAGLQYTRGEVVVMMDADLQHPPEIILWLYKKWEENFDIVNTQRNDDASIGRFKKNSSGLYYRLINFISDVHIEPASSDFRLMSRRCVDAFLQLNERDRFTRGLVGWMGFRQTVVRYNAPPRLHGKSKYNLKRMVHLGLDGITAFSAKPLRISFFAGVIVFFLGVLYSIFAVINYFLGKNIQGWTSLLVTVLLLSGVQLVSIGIVGEYISRVFNEAKARPLFFVKDFIGEVESKL